MNTSFKPRILRELSVFVIILAFAGCGQEKRGISPVETGPQTIGNHGILHRGMQTVEQPVTLGEAGKKKKETVERLDRQGLLSTGKVVVDKDPAMLVPPQSVSRYAGNEYVVAKEPPEVEYAIVPVEPLFLGTSPVPSQSALSNEPGPWSCWCQANYDTRTGKFYSAVGDHGKYNAHIFLVEYDSVTRSITCLPEINKVLGRTEKQFSEGKIHGWLDFYQSAQLDTSHLWYCTYWAKYPEPDEEDYATGYDGGHIMSYDVMSGDIVDYGIPLVRASWPYHRVDIDRGIMYAVGMFGEFLAWDINRQQTRYAGYLPPGMGWWERAIMIDDKTGMVYTTNRDASDTERHVIRYDPVKNRFFKLDCHMPVETRASNRGQQEGGYSHLRAQTRTRGPDGLFWCVTIGGRLFTFNPETEEIIDRGYNWPGEQRYTASMDRSPGGRYVYYLPGAHGRGYLDGSPVVQYDTGNGTKKVLAFLFPYYFEQYGYTPGGTFSIKLSDDGGKLFILFNGAFVEQGENGAEGDIFGQCSAMVVNIPASERVE